MSNRFLISTAVVALIAGTGFANAQGTGTSKEAPAAQQSAPSSEHGGAASGTMKHEEKTTPASGMEGAESSGAKGSQAKIETSETDEKGGTTKSPPDEKKPGQKTK